MFTTPRKSTIYKQLEILSRRTTLNEDQKNILRTSKSGHEGELYFSSLLQKNLNHPIQIYDLQLKLDGRLIQIDCLLIYQNECVIIEVKNYQSEFINEGEKWKHRHYEKLIVSPVYQVQRASTLLQNFFYEIHIHLNVHHYIVFTHPKFLLYNASVDDSIIFPSQIPKFIENLKHRSSRCSIERHLLADRLKSMHIGKSIFEQELVIDFDHIKKGVLCKECNTLIKEVQRTKLYCDNCKSVEYIREVVLRSIEEFNLLFSDKRITVHSISEWTGYIFTNYQIRNVLRKNFKAVLNGKATYYLPKEN